MSTLETAIVFTAVLTFLTFLITGTEELAINSLEAARDGSAETPDISERQRASCDI
ncbi:MAG: hypothetical protein LKM40_02435 [Mageeibacillus sp.]|jgi:hypothetical protein|nr:hypothetical protein [Mageeibacillus sp.]